MAEAAGAAVRSWIGSAARSGGRVFAGAAAERLAMLALLGLLCLVRVWDPWPLQYLRVRSFDLYQILRPSIVTERPAIIVDIDEESLRIHGQWPWPRTLLAKLIDRLAGYNVAAVGTDMIFAEPDRSTPARYAQSMPELPGHVRDVLSGLDDNDAIMAAAFKKVPVVLGIALLRRASAGDQQELKLPPIAALGNDPRPNLLAGPQLLLNVPTLQRAAAGTGIITYNSEFDGIVRRVPALINGGGRVLPSLAIEMIRVATGGRTLVVKTGPDGVESIVFSGEGGPNVEVPTDRRGRLWVHFSRSDPARYISAADVLSGKADRARLEGRLALVGTSAVGLLDIKSTPLEQQMPGVEIHAQLIENILFRDHIARPYYADAVEFFAFVLLSLMLIFILPKLGALRTMLSGFLLVVLLLGGTWLLYAVEGLLFDVTYPLLASFALFIALSFVNYLREERQKRWVRGAFARYLSPDIVAEIASHPERLNLGGEMRELTILFTDIRGFTAISENLGANDLTRFLNRFFTPLTAVIMRHGGTVDKFIGDAIMAYWNAPLTVPNHPEKACRAALEMLAAVTQFNRANAALATESGQALPEVKIGIGLNTGLCCVGNMGADQRFDYSAIGDPVNVASRLEGETKDYGVPVVIGETTAAAVPHLGLLKLGGIRVRGRAGTTNVYALVGDETKSRDPSFIAVQLANDRYLASVAAGDWA
ncbi:MAG: CHASE2 domain-containing protein, partial [Alphaproteobacteria bacterium]